MIQTTKFYRRNLPHFHPETGCFFITSRLADTISKKKLEQLVSLKNKIAGNAALSQKEKKIIRSKNFNQLEEFLTRGDEGPKWLQDDNIAQIIADSLMFYDNLQYELYCYTIMSNHVHSVINLVENSLPLSTILQRHKRFTARECNKLLTRRGAFWHPESYDHVITNNEELERVIEYTLNNPVKAGLVSDWKQWKWSYLKAGLLF